jgi:hypothetical protein
MFCTYGRAEMKRFDNREERTPEELSFLTMNVSLLVFPAEPRIPIRNG